MISKQAYAYCCEDLSLIENYEKAISDTVQTWRCHHRLEINDGYLLSSKELEGLELYYNRPANELIFLTLSEHNKLHGSNKRIEQRRALSEKLKNRVFSQETRDKLSKALKGRKQSEEMRKINSECHKGIKHTEEYKQRMSELHKSLVTDEMRIKTSLRFKGKPKSEETRKKMSEAAKKKIEQNKNYGIEMSLRIRNSENYKIAMNKRKGEKWWNNGVICVRRIDCPEGFVSGRLRK